MEEIAKINREKNVYKLSNDEFIEGNWLNNLKDCKKEKYDFEIRYINNFLTIKKFITKKPVKE